MTEFTPTPFQQKVLGCPFNLMLPGGRGGGKTTGAFLAMVQHAQQYNSENPRIAFTRRTIPSLRTPFKEFRALLTQLGVNHVANKNEMTVTTGNTEIVFLPCDDLAYLAERIQGSSFSMLVGDELSAHPTGEVLLSLMANLRHPTIPTKFIGLTNPGNFAAWIHGKWLAHSPGDGVPFDVDGMRYVVLHSTMDDNPHLDVKKYETTILASVNGNQTRYKEMRNGVFGLISHAFFNIPQEALIKLPPLYTVREFTGFKPVGCLDFGTSAPFYFGLFLRATQNDALAPNGETYPRGSYLGIAEAHSALADDYTRGRPTDIAEHARMITQLCDQFDIPVPTTVADSQIFAKIGVTTQSDTYRELGIPVIRGAKPHNSVSFANVQTYLSNARSQNNRALAGLYMDRGMDYLINSLMYAPTDARNPEIVSVNYPQDHAIDGLKYMLSTKTQTARTSAAPWEVDSAAHVINAAQRALKKRERRARAMGLPSANGTTSFGRNYRR